MVTYAPALAQKKGAYTTPNIMDAMLGQEVPLRVAMPVGQPISQPKIMHTFSQEPPTRKPERVTSRPTMSAKSDKEFSLPSLPSVKQIQSTHKKEVVRQSSTN